MLRDRFLAYLTGGHGPGNSGRHDGARDQSLPIDDQPVRIDRRLIFTGRSRRWGGGVCAVTSPFGGVGQGECLGRAWLISANQLLDVWRQENGGLETTVVPWPELERRGHVDDPAGRYRRLERLEPLDGQRAVTITCGPEMAVRLTPPTPAYLDLVAAGLAETWQLGPDDARRYLRHHAEGVTGPWPG